MNRHGNGTRGARLLLVAALMVSVAGALVVPRPARAVTFEVTNNNASGAGSLRQAITDANNNPGSDLITFVAATDGIPIVLLGPSGDDANASGDLDVLPGGLIIQGNGPTNTIVDAGGFDRVFHICPGGGCSNPDAVTLYGITIVNGAGVVEGGGVHNNGAPLTVQECVVGRPGYGNTAAWGGGSTTLLARR